MTVVLKYIFSFVCLGWIGCHLLQAQSFEELYAKAIQYYEQKDYQSAISFVEKASPLAKEKLSNIEDLINFWSNKGKICLSGENFQKAEACYQEAYLLRTKVSPDKPLEHIKILQRLAQACFLNKNMANASLYYQKILSILITHQLENKSEYWQSLENLAIVFEAQQLPQKADSIYQLILNKKKLLTSPSTERKQQWVEMLLNSARFYETQQNEPKAQKLYAEVLTYLQPKNQADSLQWAKISCQYAKVSQKLEDYPIAEKQFKQSLGIFKRLFPLYVLDYAYFLQDIAAFYQEISNFALAEEYYRLSLQLLQKNVGEQNPFYAQVLDNLATLLIRTHQYQEAELLLQKALQIFKATVGNQFPDYAQVLHHQADVYQITKQLVKSEKLYLEALQIKEAILEKNHPAIALTLNNLAELYDLQKNYERSEPLYLRALQIQQKLSGKNSQYYRRTLLNLIHLYRQQKQIDKALALCRVLLETNNAKNPANKALIFSEMASLCYAKGDWTGAAQWYRQALDLYQSITHLPADYLQALSNLASVYQNEGKYWEAEKLHLQALSFAKTSFGDKSWQYAAELQLLASLWQFTGKWEETEKALQEAYQILHQFPQNQFQEEKAQLFQKLGNLAQARNDFIQAERQYLQTQKILKEIKGEFHPDYADILSKLASLYKRMGKMKESEKLLNQILQIRKNTLGEKHPDYALTLQAIAEVYTSDAQPQQAESFYLQALQICKQSLGENHIEYATALDNLAMFYLKQKKYAESEKLYLKSLAIRKKILGEQHTAYAVSLNNLAVLYENATQKAKTEDFYLKAAAILKQNLGEKHPDYAKVLNNLANFYEKSERFAEAEKIYKTSIDIITFHIQTHFKALSEEEKRLFYEKNKLYLQNYIHFALYLAEKHQKTHLLPNVLNLQLLTKGMILDATAQSRRNILQSKNTKVIQLFESWQNISELLAKYYTDSSIEISARQLDSLENTVHLLEKKLVVESQLFASTFHSEAITWQDIQAKLLPNEIAIETIRLQPSDNQIVYAFLLIQPNQKSPELILLSNGKELESKYLYYYKNMIRFEGNDKYSYLKYWSAIAQKIPAQDKATPLKIYFSGDGVYHQIALHSLKNQTTGRYLWDETDIVWLTNLREIVQKPTPQPAGNGEVALFGRPNFKSLQNLSESQAEFDLTNITDLPATEKEVKTIQKILQSFKRKAKIYLGAEANELCLKNLTNVSVLHIATHGYFLGSDENMPMFFKNFDNRSFTTPNPMWFSGLLLAKDETESSTQKSQDGLLTAWEVAHLNLQQTELVVLSACETGLGKIRNGEGVYGLQRAFRIAGAQTILMSLWQIEDVATQKWMSFFYEEWAKTKNKKSAFRTAQQKMQELYEKPYYWAGFILVGE